MTNLILHYLHRDEGNWKDRFEVCIQNPTDYTAEQAEGMLRECLIDGEFFYPQKVGLSFSIATDLIIVVPKRPATWAFPC
jgi:hypothetical protein